MVCFAKRDIFMLFNVHKDENIFKCDTMFRKERVFVLYKLFGTGRLYIIT